MMLAFMLYLRGNKMLSRNRKGQVDVLTVAIIIFVIGILAMLSFKFLGGINTAYQADVGLSNSTKNVVGTYTANYATAMDQGILIAVGICFMLTLILAYRIDTNPGYFFITLFILLILLGITAIFGQVFDQGTNTNDFATERAAMPGLVFVASNIFGISLAMFVLISIVIYAKVTGNS